ncbi:MAG: cation-transporting P-type ATPase [Proteobacteria bacterium]|nr:cation-transporting P-type ATPase [Pseudomonadota bacterium]MBU1739187.1 cation-transporting P-type ATPase [Pseudomonadota bacterium]
MATPKIDDHPPETSRTAWHSMGSSDVLTFLQTTDTGLNGPEAAKRQQRYGANRITPPQKRSPLLRFFLQFHNTLIYVLIGAGLVTAFLEHWIDAGVILGVVVINALIGFIQEGKAEKALEAIRDILSLNAVVLRDGKRRDIPAEEITVGDIVFLQSGDKVPADLRLIRVKELRVDEAALTGESEPVAKNIQPAAREATIGDHLSMAYSGTLVTYGQGTGVAVAIGDATELGRISRMLATVKPITTRLLQQIADFGQKITVAILIMAFAAALFGILVRNYGLTEMFLAAVGLAVAAIPEGLPAIITITLAIGVQRMAGRNAIIRLLPAVESLGSVTVICSDKTGTLTRNEMTVQTVASAREVFEVDGSGYAPHGGFQLDGRETDISNYPDVLEMARAAMLCNDASLEQEGGQWRLQGDPTEGALLTLALKANLAQEQENKSYPRTDIIPFESEHRFMATLHHDHASHGFIYVKGAPERILEMCSRERRNGEDAPLDTRYWQDIITRTADKGQRLLAIAFRPADADHHDLNFADVDGGLTLLGLFGIIDPPRPDAIEAVGLCGSAGIKVKMITGDHGATARAIARQIGISEEHGVLTGQEIEKMDDHALSKAVAKVNIFARVSPEHKLRLVRVLQESGEIVSMTGDGVNDAPALKRADVGVAMGIKGTEVSKEAAEMVLADDNFSSIVQAVKEGRTVYDNIRKAITFILPTNGGEAGLIIAAILSGRLLPITPVQILWVNMVTAVTLALTLAFEPAEEGIMERKPRDPQEPLLSYFLVWRIIFVSLLLVIGTFGLFLWERMHGVDIDRARTIAVNTLVMFEIFYLFNTRSLKTPIWRAGGFFANSTVFIAVVSVLAAQFLFTYLPFMQDLFSSVAISFDEWLRILMVTAPIMVIVEIEKVLLSRWEAKEKALPIHPTRRD